MKLLADLIDNVLKGGGGLADINPGVRTELEQAVAVCKGGWRKRPSDEEVLAAVSKGIADVWSCCARCESPIEKLIVPWLIFQDYQLTPAYSPASLIENGVPSISTYCLEPQVSLGGSRFDFILAARIGNRGVMLAIECDGKEFHDPAKDFYRDRSWQVAGLPTFRLSGSTIHLSPQRAAMQVAQALHDQAHKEGLI